MTLMQNTFESGQSSGTALSVANSGFTDTWAEEPTTTAATIAYSSAQAQKGSLSALFTFSNVSGNAYCKWTQTGARTTVARFYIYVSARPSTSGMGLFTLTPTTTTNKYCNFVMNNEGRVALYDYAGGYSSPEGDTTLSTATLALSTWYRVEIVVDNSGGTTAGTATVSIYEGDATGTPYMTWTTTSKNYGSANFVNLYLGRYFATTANGTPTIYFDDLGWDTGTTTPLGPTSSATPLTITAQRVLIG